ncbi:MAG: FecR domain-containing protein [Sphingobacterium sp.]
MPKRYEHIARLIAGHLKGELSAQDRIELNAWLDERPSNRSFLERLQDEGRLEAKLKILHAVDREGLWALTQKKLADGEMLDHVPQPGRFRRWLPYVAAMLIGAFLLAWYFAPTPAETVIETVEQVPVDTKPGGHRATLKLTDGRRISLDETRQGIIIGPNGVTYNDGDPLANIHKEATRLQEIDRLELHTPHGGMYQITLPDGSQVWLNAGSTLKYPSRFSADQREVELEGEGYFVVTRDLNRPFTVRSGEHRVRVLGTAFNINAYPDQSELITTLVEGSVDVIDPASASHILRPGQQAIFDGEQIKVAQVDVSYYTSWKDGRFTFNREELSEVLKQIERWYDVEFVSKINIEDVQLWGTLSRDVMLSELLKVLELNTELKFKQEGRRVIVDR